MHETQAVSVKTTYEITFEQLIKRNRCMREYIKTESDLAPRARFSSTSDSNRVVGLWSTERRALSGIDSYTPSSQGAASPDAGQLNDKRDKSIGANTPKYITQT